MIDKYIEIFSDPYFWLMVAIAVAVCFWVYRKYVVGNTGVSEEVELLKAQLAHFGYAYLNSQTETENIPFAPLPEPKTTANEEAADADTPAIYTYRSVQAQNSNGQTIEFWTRFEYKNAAITAVYWSPDVRQRGYEL